MAAKKTPITVGKGTSYTRPVTPGDKPRPVSAKPGQASLTRAAKKTTSDKGRAGRQSISKAQITTSGGGTPGSAKVTTGSGGKPSGTFKAPSIPTRKGQPQTRPNQGLSIGGAGRLGAAAAGLQAYNTADGTLTAAQKRGDYKPKQGPANPDQGLSKAQSFDKAFTSARKSGMKTFDWNGKKYTTEMK